MRLRSVLNDDFLPSIFCSSSSSIAGAAAAQVRDLYTSWKARKCPKTQTERIAKSCIDYIFYSPLIQSVAEHLLNAEDKAESNASNKPMDEKNAVDVSRKTLAINSPCGFEVSICTI